MWVPPIGGPFDIFLIAGIVVILGVGILVVAAALLYRVDRWLAEKRTRRNPGRRSSNDQGSSGQDGRS